MNNLSLEDSLFGTSINPDIHELEYEDVADVLDNYKIDYKIINCKGRVSYFHDDIKLNPMYNEDADTLMHEFVHIYCDRYLNIHDMPEDIIENIAQAYLKSNPGARHFLDCYILERLDANDC